MLFDALKLNLEVSQTCFEKCPCYKMTVLCGLKKKNKNPTKTAPSPTGAKTCAYSKTVQLLYVFIVVKLKIPFPLHHSTIHSLLMSSESTPYS